MNLKINISLQLLVGFFLTISCKQTPTPLKSEDNTPETKVNTISDFNHLEKMTIDTLYLNTSQIIFFKPSEVRYNELVQKYGQAVVEADSDFGFTIKNLTETNFSIKVPFRVVKNNSVIYDRIGNEIYLPQEETNSYGAILFSKKMDSLKIIKGIFPAEFYLEEFNNWEW